MGTGSNVANKPTAQVTGVSDVAYDLMIVLTNKLEGVAAMQEYMQDAEEAGDSDARACFERLAKSDREAIDELKPLLVKHLGQGGAGGR